MKVIANSRKIPLREGSVQTVVTSIPYWGKRTYGDSKHELGKDQTIAEYLRGIRAVCRQLWDVLDDTGTFWLNCDDTAVGSGGAGGDWNNASEERQRFRYRQGRPILPDGSRIEKGQFGLIPERLLIMLQDDGWMVRWKGIWRKPSRTPEHLAHVKRPGLQHENLFLLTKQSKYLFLPKRLPEQELGSVWDIPKGRSEAGTTAAYDISLPIRCIRSSTERDQIVLDPFCGGSATTLRAAEVTSRIGIGLDLY